MTAAKVITVKQWQQRLIEQGYSLGPDGADGIAGPNTRRAVKYYQFDNSIVVRWPGTVGPKTLASLFEASGAVPEPRQIEPPWITLAYTKLGLSEHGATHDALAAWLKSDGETVGDPAVLPWCGDFVSTCLALTLPNEPQPGNPYWARNWAKFGEECESDKLGAVLVYARGDAGHVAFRGLKATLGGNQGDKVSEAKESLPLIAARFPKTWRE